MTYGEICLSVNLHHQCLLEVNPQPPLSYPRTESRTECHVLQGDCRSQELAVLACCVLFENRQERVLIVNNRLARTYKIRRMMVDGVLYLRYQHFLMPK